MDLLALCSLAFVGSITPGPNNVMLWASGVNHGLRRTLPHVLGISLGFASLLLASALGLGALVTEVPALQWVVRLAGAGYLLWLAWRVATSGAATGDRAERPPLSLWQAACFQYVNPKAWVLGVTAAGIAQGSGVSSVVWVALFSAINLPCIMVWAGAGTAVGRLLAAGRWRVALNRFLGGLLAASVVLVVV